MLADLYAQLLEFESRIWDYKGRIRDNKIEEIYKRQSDTLIASAVRLQSTHPEMVGLFWAKVLKSKFTMRFLLSSDILQTGIGSEHSLSQKVIYICHSFENSYHYFGFMSLCNTFISTDPVDIGWKNWYKPDVALESGRKTNWMLNGNKTSGKFWALNNSPFVVGSESTINLIKDVRDWDSHGKIIYDNENDRILIIDEKNEGTIIISRNELENICIYIGGLIDASFHFYAQLFGRLNFWIIPSIIITHNSVFKFESAGVSFDLLEEFKIPDNDGKKIDGSRIFNKKFLFIIILLLQFGYYSLWKSLVEHRELIDKVVGKHGLQFDESEVENTKNSVRQILFETVEALYKNTKDSVFEYQRLRAMGDSERDTKLDRGREILSEILVNLTLVIIVPIQTIRSVYSDLIKPK